jgi:hypothetical protein
VGSIPIARSILKKQSPVDSGRGFLLRENLFNILPLPEFDLNRFQFAFKPAKLLIQTLKIAFGQGRAVR